MTCARTRWIVGFGVFIAVWAMRTMWVGKLGVGIPFWDQWDREGMVIYEPYLRGELTWSALLAAHLEHRILWTHLWNLLLLKVAGQWDPLVQMVAQGVLPAATAGVLAGQMLVLRTERIWRGAVIGGTLGAFGLPLAQANILWGFQSQFGFLIALCLLVGAAAARALTSNRGWGLLLGAGLAAPLAMGAGALAGPMIASMALIVFLTRRSRPDGMVRIGLIVMACTGWGWLCRAEAPIMQFAWAGSFRQFLEVWAAYLAWPNSDYGWLAWLGGLPMAGLLLWFIRTRTAPPGAVLFLFGLGVFVAGSAAGGAWYRGAVDPVPSLRYYDFLAIYCFANLLALVWLFLTVWVRNRGWRLAVMGLALLWLGAVGMGGARLLVQFGRFDYQATVQKHSRWFESLNQALNGAPVDVMLAAGLHNRPQVLAHVLSSPGLSRILPAELLKPPAGMTPDQALAVGFAAGEQIAEWQGGVFQLERPALIAFTRGAAENVALRVRHPDGTGEEQFSSSGRRIGEWHEWLVEAGEGPRRLVVTRTDIGENLVIWLPRALSLSGYWCRKISANTFLLIGLIVGSLSLVLWAALTKTDKERRSDLRGEIEAAEKSPDPAKD